MGSRNGELGRPGVLSKWLSDCRITAAMPFLQSPVLDIGCGDTAPLARHFSGIDYLGVEIHALAREAAQQRWPEHTFATPNEIPSGVQFNSIAALAVLEHVRSPNEFLAEITQPLAGGGSLVLTTPSPAAEPIHTIGSRLGVFSRRASDEHESLLGRGKLLSLVNESGLELFTYRRFLFGMNQLLVAKKPEK